MTTDDPSLIFTIRGLVPLAGLRKEVIVHERPKGRSTWTEYYDDATNPPTLMRRDIAARAYSTAELKARNLTGGKT